MSPLKVDDGMGGEKYAQLSCRWARGADGFDDVGEVDGHSG